MTQDEYFTLLKERWEQVDKTSREAIHEYNEWKRELRHMIDADQRIASKMACTAVSGKPYRQ